MVPAKWHALPQSQPKPSPSPTLRSLHLGFHEVGCVIGLRPVQHVTSHPFCQQTSMALGMRIPCIASRLCMWRMWGLKRNFHPCSRAIPQFLSFDDWFYRSLLLFLCYPPLPLDCVAFMHDSSPVVSTYSCGSISTTCAITWLSMDRPSEEP